MILASNQLHRYGGQFGSRHTTPIYGRYEQQIQKCQTSSSPSGWILESGHRAGSYGWLCMKSGSSDRFRRKDTLWWSVPCVAGTCERDASPIIHLTQRAALVAHAASPPRNNMFAADRNMRYRVKRSFTFDVDLRNLAVSDPGSEFRSAAFAKHLAESILLKAGTRCM